MAEQPGKNHSKWPLWSAHSSRVLIVVGIILALDQVSKLWILFGLKLAEGEKLTVTRFFDIVLVWNRGISYGLFQQHSDWGQWLLIVFGFVACIVVWIWTNRSNNSWFVWGAALIIGGGIGNSIDRIAYGAVIDFVSLHGFGFYWYVFNVADIAIVAGFLLLLYDMFLSGKEKPS